MGGKTSVGVNTARLSSEAMVEESGGLFIMVGAALEMVGKLFGGWKEKFTVSEAVGAEVVPQAALQPAVLGQAVSQGRPEVWPAFPPLERPAQLIRRAR